ncbi:hypothetical protein Bpfe_027804, partial [Biomphalaria pfeifferi]
ELSTGVNFIIVLVAVLMITCMSFAFYFLQKMRRSKPAKKRYNMMMKTLDVHDPNVILENHREAHTENNVMENAMEESKLVDLTSSIVLENHEENHTENNEIESALQDPTFVVLENHGEDHTENDVMQNSIVEPTNNVHFSCSA